MTDACTIGHKCPGCGASFLLASSLERHREAAMEARVAGIPSFRAEAEVKNAIAADAWRERQIETGRLTRDGEWARDWRPQTVEGPANDG